MATPIDRKRLPNASFICEVTPASSIVDAVRDLAGGHEASISCWTSRETAPVSSLAISAETVAAGAWSTRVMLPWAATSSTAAIVPSGTVTAVPTGSSRSVSTLVTCRGVDLDEERDGVRLAASSWTVVASWPTSAVRTSPGDLRRGEPGPDRLVGIHDDLDLGRALGEVGLEVEEVGVVGEGGHHLDGRPPRRRRGCRELMTMLRPFEVKPAVWATATS